MLSAEARRTGVEGTVRIRCVITAAGTVEGCEVLERLPLAEAAVLAAIQARRYRPAEIEGRAVSVRHLFTIRIRRRADRSEELAQPGEASGQCRRTSASRSEARKGFGRSAATAGCSTCRASST